MTADNAYDKRMKPLVDEYTSWLTANKLPDLSADEQETDDWTPAQRAWLFDFINRWEELEDGA